MRRPTATQADTARRLFASEAGEVTSAEDRAIAAGRVHEKLFGRLAALVGTAGARALFARSVKLAANDFPSLRTVAFDARSAESEPFVAGLRGLTPDAVTEATVAVYAAMLSLLETLIGPRLTANVLHSAWPALDSPKETR